MKKSRKKIKVICDLVAGPDAKVIALNYRNNEWERGTVQNIVIHVHRSNINQFPNHLTTTAHYEVLLDRRSTKGNRIIITVGIENITLQP